MIILDEAKYPVVDPCPSFWTVNKNFGFKDYGYWAGFTLAGVPVGYNAGKSAGIIRPTIYFTMFLGATAGYMFIYRQSFARLAGIRPNEREVAAAGLNK